MHGFNTVLSVVLLCWSLIVLVSSRGQINGYSRSTVDFLNIMNGYYDNQNQVQEGFSDNSFSRAKVVPVDIPILRPVSVMYTEWEMVGKMARGIYAVSEGPGEAIRLTMYSMSDPRVHKFGEFNVSTLSDLTREDLGDSNCTGLYKSLRPGVFSGYYQDCTTTIEGHHPFFADTVTCDVVATITPPTAGAFFSITPYIFQRKGNRYPLIGLPDTFDRVCGKAGQPSQRGQV